MREVLVIGAGSAIGRALAERVRRDFPGARITGLARRAVEAPFDRSFIADLRGDIPLVDGTFDFVIHAAAAVPAYTAATEDYDRVNVRGATNLFNALSLTDDCVVLNLSTCSVYDDPDAPELREDSAKTAANAYGVSKLRFEEVLHGQIARPGQTVLSVRIPVLLAPGVRTNFVVAWLACLERGGPLRVFNPGALFNAVVDDHAIHEFAKAFMAAHQGKHLSCNVSAAHAITVREAARIVARTAQLSAEIIEVPAQKRAQTVNHELALRFGFVPPDTAHCLAAFVERR